MESNGRQLHPKSSDFVRKYLTGIFLIMGLFVLSVFWGFNHRSNALIKAQLLKQGQAFFGEVLITREWAAKHGGVYVPITKETVVNPYLLKIPGLKVVIRDTDGIAYTLKNPALITRELSELAAKKEMLKFRITSLNPLNPDNSPDLFEKEALTAFSRGEKEFYRFITDAENQVSFRYMAPLITEQSCLKCHAYQGYRVGDVLGGISVSIPTTGMLQQMQENRLYITLIALMIVGVIYAIIRYVAHVLIGDLSRAEQQLQEMANHDFLTSLLNRREAFRQIGEEVERANRTARPLAFILFDIDHFKRLNDTYGHNAGDMVLTQLAVKLKAALRDYDIACRYGGEEFLVVSPETDLEQALRLAERLRVTIASTSFSTESAELPVTVSIGVTLWQQDDTIEKAIARADEALYQAKAGGRNQVCSA